MVVLLDTHCGVGDAGFIGRLLVPDLQDVPEAMRLKGDGR